LVSLWGTTRSFAYAVAVLDVHLHVSIEREYALVVAAIVAAGVDDVRERIAA
jgi:hypothetical protein